MGRDVKFSGLQDVSIDATGACFWFDPRFGVRLEKCRNIKLAGLTIDSDPLPWTQGTIEELDPAAQTLLIRIDDGYFMPGGQQHRILFFDSKTQQELPVVDDWAVEMEPAGERRVKILRLNSARVFRDPVPERPVRAGDRVVLLPPSGGGGNIRLKDCEAVTLENVSIHGANASAFLETMGEGGNHYTGCKLVRRPSSNRLIAALADGFHSYLMRQGPVIEHCEFSHTGDDLMNIHGFFGVVLKPVSPEEFLLAAPFGRLFDAGSELAFTDSSGNDTSRHATVASVDEIQDKGLVEEARHIPQDWMREFKIRVRSLDDVHVFRVKLDREIGARRFDVVSSGDYCAQGAVVRNSHFHDSHGRGVLARGPDLLVENNRIERTAHGGIVIEPELYWLEGPLAKNIRILNNALVQNGWSAFDRVGLGFSLAAIQVGTHFGKSIFPRTLVSGIHASNIEIAGNKIQQPAGFGILVMNSSGVRIADNTISGPFAAGPQPAYYDFSKLPDPKAGFSVEETSGLDAPYYAIFLFATRDVSISGNSCKNPPPFLKGISSQPR